MKFELIIITNSLVISQTIHMLSNNIIAKFIKYCLKGADWKIHNQHYNIVSLNGKFREVCGRMDRLYNSLAPAAGGGVGVRKHL